MNALVRNIEVYLLKYIIIMSFYILEKHIESFHSRELSNFIHENIYPMFNCGWISTLSGLLPKSKNLSLILQFFI